LYLVFTFESFSAVTSIRVVIYLNAANKLASIKTPLQDKHPIYIWRSGRIHLTKTTRCRIKDA
jgi:hypothetical protein